MFKGCLIYLIYPLFIILFLVNNNFFSIKYVTTNFIYFWFFWAIFDLVRKIALQSQSLLIYFT